MGCSAASGPASNRPARMIRALRNGWSRSCRPSSKSGDAVSQVLLAPIKHASEEHEAINKWIREANTQRDREELKRLLYVGCTRARQQVHCSANARKKRWTIGECLQADTAAHRVAGCGGEFRSALARTTGPRGKWRGNCGDAGPYGYLYRLCHRRCRGQVESIAAAEDSPHSNRVVPLSNFQRLRSDWNPPAALADIPMSVAPAWQEESAISTMTTTSPAFQRPQGSWRARVFGTVLHAFLEPLANILEQNSEASAQARSIDALGQPIRLQLLSNGHPPKEAARDATRIVAALHSVAADKLWAMDSERAFRSIRAGPATFLSRGFEVPLTAMHGNVLRSIRVDRLFVAGAVPTSSRYGCALDCRFQDCVPWRGTGGGVSGERARAICGTDAVIRRYRAHRLPRNVAMCDWDCTIRC